jgi:tetratricopeptide (TPR) repeat protein
MVTALVCTNCSAAVAEGDRFCGACGATLAGSIAAPEPRAQAPAGEALLRALTASQHTVGIDALLSVRLPFCWACGVDHDPGAAVCPACARATAPLPERQEGPLGLIYSFRRGLRKRLAVRIADEDGGAKLLFESGESTVLELEALPEPVESPIADSQSQALRSARGRLLAVAQACRGATSKSKWDPEVLEGAALDGVEDELAARLLALDALLLKDAVLLERLPLTKAERQWLIAVQAAADGESIVTVAAIVSLPHDAYRPKLGLLAKHVRAAAAAGGDLAPIAAHLEPYLDSEPLAALLFRELGFSALREGSEQDILQIAYQDRALAGALPLPEDLACELGGAFDALTGQAPAAPGVVRSLPTNARVLLALGDPRPGLIRTEDIDDVPLPLLDDLLDTTAVAGDVALAGSTDPHRTRYLYARIAPGMLDDADIEQLEHNDEHARRIFCQADPQALEAAGQSAALRHYRSLLAFARGEQGALEDLHPQARPAVEDLLGLRAAKAEGRPLSQALGETLLADPSMWPVLIDIAGPTALKPTPELQRRFPEFAEWLALHEAREHLFLGEWHAAANAAERCLVLAKAEAVRDEALNLKACALHNRGEDAQAIAALEKAIEGAHSEALLANIGIVAAGLEPEVAARHLGVLIDEAPTTPLRAAAAHRALTIWSSVDTGSWRNSDNSPLPDAFQDALRRLVLAPLELEDFRCFASVLARYDSEWFASEPNIASSPHAGSLEARFYVARAQDLVRMIEVMGKAIAHGSPPQWILDERDSLRSAALDILFENLDEPDSMFGTVALAMVDNAVLADQEDRVLFTALGIAGITHHLSERNEEVADRVVALLHQLRGDWQQLHGEDRERIESLVELATRRVAINLLHARARDFDEGVDVFNAAIDLGGNAEPGSPAYMEALRRFDATANMCRSIRDELRRWVPIVDHEGVRDELNKLIEMTRDLEGRALEILS